MPWFYSPSYLISPRQSKPLISNSFFYPYYHPPDRILSNTSPPPVVREGFSALLSCTHSPNLSTPSATTSYACETPNSATIFDELSDLRAYHSPSSVVSPPELLSPQSSTSRTEPSSDPAPSFPFPSLTPSASLGTSSMASTDGHSPSETIQDFLQTNVNSSSTSNPTSLAVSSSLSSQKSRRFITVLSFNVLSQTYLVRHQSELYLHHSPSALEWIRRRELIIEEILVKRPDVVCLQEVESRHFHDFFSPVLAKYGFVGVFQPRCRPENDMKPDGVAIFYRDAKFHLLESHPVDMNKGVGVLTRDNVALIAVLEPVADVEAVDAKGQGSILSLRLYFFCHPLLCSLSYSLSSHFCSSAFIQSFFLSFFLAFFLALIFFLSCFDFPSFLL